MSQGPCPSPSQGELVLPELGAGPWNGLQPSLKAFTTCHLGRSLEAGEAEQGRRRMETNYSPFPSSL